MVIPASDKSVPRGLHNTPGIATAPRFGFAYDPFGKAKTAIRGGVGIFYTRNDNSSGPFIQTPITRTPTLFYGTFDTFKTSAGLDFPQAVNGIDRNQKPSNAIDLSFSVQQDVGKGVIVDVGYVGNLGRNLLWRRNLNPVPFGANFLAANADPTNPRVPLAQPFLRPMVGYTDVNMVEWASSSNYHSLQVTANRRFAKGLDFGLAYTWSKGLNYQDDNDAAISAPAPPRIWQYGLAGYDRAQVLKLNFVWAVPKAPWKNAVSRIALHDWNISGIATMSSGAPTAIGYSFVNPVDITGTASQGARVSQTGDANLPGGEKTFLRNFRTEVFVPPAVGTIGNSARTSVRLPGFQNWDLTAAKAFPVTERARLQFRAEFYNALNHTQFSSFDTAARFDAQNRQINARFGEMTAARAGDSVGVAAYVLVLFAPQGLSQFTMMERMWRALVLLFALTATGQDAVKILEARCAGCHNAKTKQGGLDLSSREAMLRGGGRGTAVVPGDVEGSLLYQMVAHRKEPGMPLGGKLSAEELAAIANWVRAGAPFEGKLEAAPHWAFQPVRRPALPASRFVNPVDRFLEAARGNAEVAPEADRYTMLRRVTLDLTGLPPTVAEIRAYVEDKAPEAYERVVDRLLASPRYGERWGRHWMDIWRYSDWYGSGAEVRNSQPHVWRWRDWIIESVNSNKRYDRMVREMLAGDEMAPEDPDTLRATGFLARNYFLFNRNVWLQDTIEGVTAGFLGLTLKCARCHDHKYDPLAQADYYRFRAYFEAHDVRVDRLAGGAGLARAFDAAPRADVQNAAGTFLSPAIFAETFLFKNGDERSPDKTRPLLPAVPPALGLAARAFSAVALPLGAHYPDMRPVAQASLVAAAREKVQAAETALTRTRARLEEARTGPKWVKPAGLEVEWESQMKPMLERRCGGCHLARNIKSGFSVASAKSVTAGGKKFGAAVVAGKSGESVLLQILRGAKSPRMPLNGPYLSDVEMAMVARWVDGMEPPDPAVVAKESELRLALGERELATARAQLASLGARVRAENAKFASGADAVSLAEAARVEERRAGVLLAEENVLRAQQRLAESPLDDAKAAAAKRALEQAAAALDTPKEGYSPLGLQYPKTSTGRRLALAEWMTARENPLTARVAVNHIWLRHFGAALVPSVIDFGRNGKAPTHPALLDWLAAEFMESGWDMKKLHRLLVTSEAYRMRSGGTGDNKLYTRANARRLEAEAVRDSVLAVAGTLDLTMGGAELNEESQAETPRRSLYFRVTPDAQLSFLKVFDGVDPTACFARAESIVPQQALALANSKMSISAARAVADGLASSTDFVGDAFLRVLGRPVSEKERVLSSEYMGDSPARRAGLIQALFNRNEFVTLR